MPIALPEGPLTARWAGPSLSAAVLFDLAQAGLAVSTDPDACFEHGRDWWPLTIGWIAHGTVPALAGAVVRPRNVEEVAAALQVAHRHRVPVTPQGGRSGVVGGAVPNTGAIALDLTALNRVLDVDEVSGTVRVEAGCFGPDLEVQLAERGLTVGHFPQSFDLATVGGWLACRGAGQYSNRYGKIEDIVRGLTVVLADGRVIETGGRAPRQAVGPDLTQLFVGAEGTLGVIVAATLVARRRADFEMRAAYSFDSIPEGLEACRRILQRGARPAVLRLYDAVESQRSFAVERCVLVVLDEGDEALVRASMGVVAAECAGSVGEDAELVARWLEHRNNVGQLAPLWERGIVVDTIEVAGAWAALATIHERVTEALRALPETVIASVHQSHAYDDGACLYFTFVGRPEDGPDRYYRAAWDAATTAVLASGGALSHHHGVGRNRARFVREALGSSFEVLEAIKGTLDPHAVMNPGVLGLGGPSW
jgi:alkyldihydroxyacetonephosphate synthase